MAFRLPTQLIIAPGCFAQLGEIASDLGVQHLILVTDPGLSRTHWPDSALSALNSKDIGVTLFGDVEPNPRASTVDKIARLAVDVGAHAVVGLGGGSVLDAAKAAAMLATNGGRILDWLSTRAFPQPSLPFIAIPTTCGTGSEVTWVSVITDESTHTKVSVKGARMFPAFALVDAELLATLPPHQIAWTGMDALTHALEATTCRLANPASDAMAEKAISLLMEHLRSAVGGDPSAREAVMRASTLAGIAFGNADVAAVHCISEALGGRWDIAHGLANAIFLPPVLRHNQPACDARLAEIAALAHIEPTGSGLVKAVEGLSADLQIPDFASLNIPAQAHAWIAEVSTQNGSNPSNARTMGVKDYLKVLSDAL